MLNYTITMLGTHFTQFKPPSGKYRPNKLISKYIDCFLPVLRPYGSSLENYLIMQYTLVRSRT